MDPPDPGEAVANMFPQSSKDSNILVIYMCMCVDISTNCLVINSVTRIENKENEVAIVIVSCSPG